MSIPFDKIYKDAIKRKHEFSKTSNAITIDQICNYIAKHNTILHLYDSLEDQCILTRAFKNTTYVRVYHPINDTALCCLECGSVLCEPVKCHICNKSTVHMLFTSEDRSTMLETESDIRWCEDCATTILDHLDISHKDKCVYIYFALSQLLVTDIVSTIVSIRHEFKNYITMT